TEDARPGILAHRPAPLQVTYLGYAGTMGAGYIDYIVGDRIVIPPQDAQWYAERIVWLPDTYQVNDSRRAIAERTPTREEVGLPQAIAPDLSAYEDRAMDLATKPVALADLRGALARNRLAMPLFDTERFRRHLEAAYVAMWEAHQRGQPPASFTVEATRP